MSDLVLYEEDIAALNALLLRFIQESHVLCALLTNKEGQLLTSQGQTGSIDVTSVAALVTGSFAATVSIANLIGEREFRTMFHRGNEKHIHICLIDDDRYLSSVFDNTTDVDKVNKFAFAYGNELRLYLESVSGNAASAYLPEINFEQFMTPEAPAVPAAGLPDRTEAARPLPANEPLPFMIEDHQEILFPGELPKALGTEAEKVSPMPNQPAFAQPSNTAYLRIKIREARTFRTKKGSDDLVAKFFGRKNPS